MPPESLSHSSPANLDSLETPHNVAVLISMSIWSQFDGDVNQILSLINSFSETPTPEQIKAIVAELDMTLTEDQVTNGYHYLHNNPALVLNSYTIPLVKAGKIPDCILRPRAMTLCKKVLFWTQFDMEIAMRTLLITIPARVGLVSISREFAASYLLGEQPECCPFLNLAILEHLLGNLQRIMIDALEDMYIRGLMLPIDYVVSAGFGYLLNEPYVYNLDDNRHILVALRYLPEDDKIAREEN